MRAFALLRKFYRYFVRPKDHWSHFASILDEPTLKYNPGLDQTRKRTLFKRNITLVELEPHAFCNRTCSFCPNSTLDRLTVKTSLDRSLYESILNDLASIEYDLVLRFARYSEPMADEHIYEMVAMARLLLPRATIDIVTNGDYLNPVALRRLREVGLSILRVSVYLRKEIAWSPEAVMDEISRLARRMQIDSVPQPSTPDTVSVRFPYDGMEIVAFSHDFDLVGYDRGQTMPQLIDPQYVRHSPCFLPATNFTVDFNGKVMPCCNLRSDHPDHKQFVIGDLVESRLCIFDVYADRSSTEWRRSLAGVGEKQAPCNTCKQKTIEGRALIKLRKVVDAKFSSLGLHV